MQAISSKFNSRTATIFLMAAALMAAPCARAQSTGQPAASAPSPQPAAVVDQLLSMVEKEMVPLAEAMPADKYNFAPTQGNFKGTRTFAQQVKHVIRANYGMFGHAASIQPNAIPNMQDLKTKEQIVQALKNSFAFAHRAIATLTPQNALQSIQPMEGVDTRAGLMLFAIVHMNDHFGQMVVYLRMNGIVPPSSLPQKH